MARRASSPGAVDADFAAFAAMAGLDLVGSTSSSAPSASLEEAAPAMGVGMNAEPDAEPSAVALPSSGSVLEVEFAAPPTSGEPAVFELTPGDEDIAPPVLGVPSSSEDEEELLADPAGAPLGGAPPAVVDTADVGVQTEHNVMIPAFDLVDVASQTDGKVAFSSFVGDTPQAALATAIRALSPGSLFRLDGALRQALAQPLVDVAPSLQGGVEAVPAPPELNLLGDTPGEQPSSSVGVVDPGPGPASARIFWEEQNATAVTEQAAVRPLPDDDFDPPATALEACLQDQDAAAGTTAVPSLLGPQSSSSKSPGGKTPFRKAPPPALVVETPEVKVGKAPPVPYPDRQIAFLAEPPKKPPVKRAPVQPQQAPPPAEATMAAALHLSLWSPRPRPSPRRRRHQKTQRLSRPRRWQGAFGGAPAPARRSFARTRWPEAWPGCGCCTTGPPTPRPSKVGSRGRWRSRRADDAAALAKAKPKGPPAHRGQATLRRFGGWVPGGAGGYANARRSTSAGPDGGLA